MILSIDKQQPIGIMHFWPVVKIAAIACFAIEKHAGQGSKAKLLVILCVSAGE